MCKILNLGNLAIATYLSSYIITKLSCWGWLIIVKFYFNFNYN